MLDPAIPEGHPASLSLRLSQWGTLLARHGPRLLAIEMIITLLGVVPALPWLVTGVAPDPRVVGLILAVSVIPGAFCAAWVWSAQLAILTQDLSGDSPRMAVGQALRAGLRRGRWRDVMRLWGWLTLVQVFSLPGLLSYLDFELAVAYLRSPYSMLVQGLSWYAAFATALLPMAILLERRGIARAWRLTHRRLSTAAGAAALLALGWSVEWLVDELPPGPVEVLGSVGIGTVLSVVTTVGLYVIYLAHIETPSRDDPIPLSHQDSGTPA